MKPLTILASLLLVSPTLAAIPVGVDFNQTGTGATQSGFNSFARAPSGVASPTSETYATPVGNLTVTIVGPAYTGNFDRSTAAPFTNGGAFTYADLLNDFAYNAFDSNPLRFQLSGPAILPNTAYPVTVWGVDSHPAGTNNTITVSPTALSGTLGGSGIIVDDGSAPVDNFSFSTTILFTSNSSGVIDFSVLGAGATSERVNGLQIFVPEPATAALLLLGLMPVLSSRTRRMK